MTKPTPADLQDDFRIVRDRLDALVEYAHDRPEQRPEVTLKLAQARVPFKGGAGSLATDPEGFKPGAQKRFLEHAATHARDAADHAVGPLVDGCETVAEWCDRLADHEAVEVRLATDGGQTRELPPVWEVWDLPAIASDRNVDPEDDLQVTSAGRVRAYFDGELMMSLHDCDFAVGFENDPGEPAGLVFAAPITVSPGEETPDAKLRTLMTEEPIPIAETRDPSPHRRRWEPAAEVAWDFEIVLETEPYTGDVDDGE